MNIELPDLDRGDGLCPRCGTNASWCFTDQDRTWVEVSCRECGKLELPRHEFDRAETELAEPEQRT
jgi:hypothetical protein